MSTNSFNLPLSLFLAFASFNSVNYTAKLYASGTKRIAQKVGEEGVETALAATVHDRFELTNEASDLMYHLLVLLQDQDLDLTTVIENLRKRHQ